MMIRCVIVAMMLLCVACDPEDVGTSLAGGDGGVSELRQKSTNCPSGNCPSCPTPESPIIVDTAGNGLQLTTAVRGVVFPLVRSRPHDMWQWPEPNGDDAFLVLDRNGNGVVDDGTEMFGNLTPQDSNPAPDGFRALRWFDSGENGGNGDGWISSRDRIWGDLRLWLDADHDGVTLPGELVTLADVGVTGFDVLNVIRADRRGPNGEEYRLSAPITATAWSSVARFVTDVWLSRVHVPVDTSRITFACFAWVYAKQWDPSVSAWKSCDAPAVADDPVWFRTWFSSNPTDPGTVRMIARLQIEDDIDSAIQWSRETAWGDMGAPFSCTIVQYPAFNQDPYPVRLSQREAEDEGWSYHAPESPLFFDSFNDIAVMCFRQGSDTPGPDCLSR